VVVSFALDAHHDSLAILTLLAALLFIISERPILSIVFLTLSFVSKFFALLLSPVLLKRTLWIYAAPAALAYVRYANAGWKLLNGPARPLRGRPALPGFSAHPGAGVRLGTLVAGVGGPAANLKLENRNWILANRISEK
jgi:hypothetical protein